MPWTLRPALSVEALVAMVRRDCCITKPPPSLQVNTTQDLERSREVSTVQGYRECNDIPLLTSSVDPSPLRDMPHAAGVTRPFGSNSQPWRDCLCFRAVGPCSPRITHCRPRLETRRGLGFCAEAAVSIPPHEVMTRCLRTVRNATEVGYLSSTFQGSTLTDELFFDI